MSEVTGAEVEVDDFRSPCLLMLRGDVALRTLSPVIPDPHAKLRDQVFQSVLQGKGESDPALRGSVADGTDVPSDLYPLVDKIHRHAYKVTDDDIAQLQVKYGDDRMFEIVVGAALGASRNRLLAGLKALDEA